jgi:phosphate butyryltransferase
MKKLSEIVDKLKSTANVARVAVAVAEDENTIGAIIRATNEGFIKPILIGSKERIEQLLNSYSNSELQIIDIADEVAATCEAVRMVREGVADVLMKGLVGTDKFLKAVLNKEKGLLPPKSVLSYTCAIEIPAYRKLLFVSDTAVLPYPDLDQKIAMVNYSVSMARRLGVDKPKVALVSSVEKVNSGLPNTMDFALISKMAERGQIKNCIVDGPLDVFLACDPNSLVVKGVNTPIAGDADILIFPSLEAANSFYKGLMLFAGAELAGMLQGTSKPCVVMSRGESEDSKYYCIALSCLMVEDI